MLDINMSHSRRNSTHMINQEHATKTSNDQTNSPDGAIVGVMSTESKRCFEVFLQRS